MADTASGSEDLSKMKVTELKKVLKERGLSVTGSKSELVARLQEAIELQASEGEQDISLEDTLAEESEETIEEEVSSAPAVKKIALAPKNSNVPQTEEAKVVLTAELSEAERLKKRAEKFGLQSDEAKKKLRAERFGVADSKSGGGKIASTPVTPGDLDKLKQRAERFGTVVSNKLSKLEEQEKIAKRKERFGAGLTTTDTSSTGKVSVNNKVMGSAEDMEKKRKRAERFGLT